MALIQACPENQNEVIEASKKLGCGYDKYGNNQYLCLPNKEKTSLIEFCSDGVMGIRDKGKSGFSKVLKKSRTLIIVQVKEFFKNANSFESKSNTQISFHDIMMYLLYNIISIIYKSLYFYRTFNVQKNSNLQKMNAQLQTELWNLYLNVI